MPRGALFYQLWCSSVPETFLSMISSMNILYIALQHYRLSANNNYDSTIFDVNSTWFNLYVRHQRMTPENDT